MSNGKEEWRLRRNVFNNKFKELEVLDVRFILGQIDIPIESFTEQIEQTLQSFFFLLWNKEKLY